MAYSSFQISLLRTSWSAARAWPGSRELVEQVHPARIGEQPDVDHLVQQSRSARAGASPRMAAVACSATRWGRGRRCRGRGDVVEGPVSLSAALAVDMVRNDSMNFFRSVLTASRQVLRRMPTSDVGPRAAPRLFQLPASLIAPGRRGCRTLLMTSSVVRGPRRGRPLPSRRSRRAPLSELRGSRPCSATARTPDLAAAADRPAPWPAARPRQAAVRAGLGHAELVDALAAIGPRPRHRRLKP